MRDKKHRLPSKSRTRVLVLAHMLLLAWAPIAHAHQLPFLMQERHLLVDLRMPIAGDQVDGMRIGYSVCNGDFPLLLHAEPGELTVYTGSPLFFPAYISAGSTNQVGYLDAYRTHTPLASLSGGWRYDIPGSDLMKDEGFFIS